MRILAIATAVATAVCMGSVAGRQSISAAPADAFISWTVSPGTFANGVWTIPGTTTLTALVVDEFATRSRRVSWSGRHAPGRGWILERTTPLRTVNRRVRSAGEVL
jgi:hypothetical protein